MKLTARMHRIVILLFTSMLIACSPFPVLNGLGSDGAYRKLSALRYGNETRQQLDVYQPAVSRNGTVVVFFYGGGWRTGQRDEYRFVAQTLTRHGVTVVIPDYRTYPTGVFPDFMHDAAAAVAWTQRHIAEYGGDPKKIYLVGHSAGAHIATLLALDKQYLVAQGLGTDILAGVVGLATPANFAATLEAKYRPAFGNQTELERAQPIRYARGDAPPSAASSMYNTDHALGDADTAIDYVKRLQDAGVDNVMCLIQMGTLTQDQQLETIRIFGEQVIPHFRSQEGAAQSG